MVQFLAGILGTSTAGAAAAGAGTGAAAGGAAGAAAAPSLASSLGLETVAGGGPFASFGNFVDTAAQLQGLGGNASGAIRSGIANELFPEPQGPPDRSGNRPQRNPFAQIIADIIAGTATGRRR